MRPKIIRITTIPMSLHILLRGQHRFMVSKGFQVIGVSGGGEELLEVRKNEEIQVIALEMTRTISPLRDLKALWKFYWVCKREKPQVVHSHTPKAGIVGMLGAKLAGVPIRLHTVAGLPLMERSGLKRRILVTIEKLTYALATKVYPNSRGLHDFIIANKFASKCKLKIIANGSSNGIDTDYFDIARVQEDTICQLRDSLQVGTDDFVYIFVGRLVRDKGVNELIAAFSQLCKSSSPRSCKLLLVGTFESKLDPLKPETMREIETHPDIIAVGFQKDVRPYLSISHVLVLPSYREGFPNVVMQAGSMGLPSIVSDINGCNEIITEGKNGTIVPAKSITTLNKAMRKMWTDKAFYTSLKVNARPMIELYYEQIVFWNALWEEYSLLIGNNIKDVQKRGSDDLCKVEKEH